MLRNKLFITAISVCALAISVCAEELSNVEFPKPPAYRVGISSFPETQYIEAQQQKTKLEKTYAQLDHSQNASVTDMTYADLSIKRISREIAQELEFEEQDMVSDLSLLWQGAAIQSDTINFALYKLANPDADKPDKNSLKKVLTTIASMSTLVGAGMGSPVLAGSSLIGGNILGIMSQDTKALNYKYTKVGDADMIILIRKVEDLQQKAVNLYYDYMSAKKQLEFTTKLVEERGEKFKLAQQNNAARELVVITDAYYRTALDKQRTAKSEFFSKRAALEQFVGNETFVQFERELTARENGETAPERKLPILDEQSETEYDSTIQNVEDFKNSITEENSQIQTQITENSTKEQSGVANIANLPNLEDLENAHIASKLTGSSSSVEDSNTGKKAKKEKKKQSKKEEAKSQTKQIEVKTKDKHSTKGLIFLHNQNTKNQPEHYEYEQKTVPIQQTHTQKQPYNPNNNGFNLAPLDEIKIPDLKPGGYSIHNGY